MRRLVAMLVLFALVVAPALTRSSVAAPASPPLLLRDPTISKTQIAFAYGGAIWIVDRAGGEAKRLVTGYDLESAPRFSPDGQTIAFSGNYDGATSVYVVPASGGQPKRLTAHPLPSIVLGWSHDGSRILFRSARFSTNDGSQLFTVPLTGGWPTRLPLRLAETAAYSPDGSHLAYVPNFRWEPYWQGYRGGQTTPILIANLADSSVTRIPRASSNDDAPMWVGDTVYFLSDRNGPITLFAYNTQNKRVDRVLPSEGFDITSASAGPDAIVYAKFDALHVYDLASHSDRTIHVSIASDLPQIAPRWTHLTPADIRNVNISPSGARAVFEAHGTIFTVPAENGDTRNISDAPNTANRDPAWSPNGRYIAFFSDRSGEYRLIVRDQKGLEPPRSIDLDVDGPTYYYSPQWSPDSKKILYSDKRLNLWYIDLANPKPVRVKTALYPGFGPNQFDAVWSPDSKWIAYDDALQSFEHAVYVYSLTDRRNHEVTDGLSDARYPDFDKSGKYLYFTASTNTGLNASGLDMTSDQRPQSANVYLTVLQRDVPSPLLPQSDDETVKPGAGGDEPDGTAPPKPAPSASVKPAMSKSPVTKPVASTADVKIDFENISQRTITLPIPAANFTSLAAAKPGEIFLSALPITSVDAEPQTYSITKFDLTSRKPMPFLEEISGLAIDANGDKALYATHGRYFIVSTGGPPKPGMGALNMGGMETHVDPHAEWAQIYHEAWRIERDFFYDGNHHGLNIDAAEKRFAAYLPGIAGRDDLTFLFREMLSYLSVGHMFVGGGTNPRPPQVSVGLLGADYAIENGRYRFTKIYNGENWNPELRAPLTAPGSDVRVGDYLLAVNGHNLTGDEELFPFFQETANKQVTLKVGPNADGTKSREVTVIPVPREGALRNNDWIQSNIRKVNELSGGKLGYVYVPDTAYGGFTSFNRYFFSQIGKEGMIVDERFNHGGQLADYIVDMLKRKPMSILHGRQGKDILDPPLAIYGPKVMLINEFSGSGGDALPWYFHMSKIGPLVGERTWGGLVGIGGTPEFIDGGFVEAPNIAIGGLHGDWVVEGHGIAPDIEVFQDPKLMREGHDPQLEAGVRTALDMLRKNPIPEYHRPPPINHHPVLPPG